MKKGHSLFEVYQDRKKEWRWRARHENGNIIADSGEGYTRRQNAQRARDRFLRQCLKFAAMRIASRAMKPAVRKAKPSPSRSKRKK